MTTTTTNSPSHRPSSPRRRRSGRYLIAAGIVVPLGLALAACGGSNDSGSYSDQTSADRAEAAPTYAGGDMAESDALSSDLDSVSTKSQRAPGTDSGQQDDASNGMDRAIIATGNVALSADDVEDAIFDVQKVVDRYRGEISEQNTTADDEGSVRNARLVLRIPSADFQDAFRALEKAANRISSTSNTEDVTTEVIDNEVRIRAQRRSLQRVEVLLDRARSISDIVRIEAQLTQRQSELDSLEQRQAYLADQTSMSTITVSIERAEKDESTQKDEDTAGGFLSGLGDGWDALVAVAAGLALVLGWMLPFLGVALIVLLPLRLAVRRARRRTAAVPEATS